MDIIDKIFIRPGLCISHSELTFSAMRSQGAGGQNVNKVSTAIHLRFDVKASSLSEDYQQRILSGSHHLLTKEGVIVIKSQETRSQEMNKQLAIERLSAVLNQMLHQEKPRRATRPTKASKKRRLESKQRHASKKQLRGKVVM